VCALQRRPQISVGVQTEWVEIEPKCAAEQYWILQCSFATSAHISSF
jgi:hypothetical protein